MEFSKEEIKVAIEATGQRYKWFHQRLADPATQAEEKKSCENTIKTVDSLLKKLLAYQKEHFPPPEPAQGEEADEQSEATSINDFSDYQLLLVDDNERDREKVKDMLAGHGIVKVDIADDGHSALAIIKEKPKPYDLVLCDLNMPTISGMDVLKLIRKEKKYSTMPFIMLSTKGNKEHLEEAIKAGVNDYIVKPISEESLLHKLGKVFQ